MPFFLADFEYSHDKHVFGKDWKSRVRDKEDLRITAYHEAGHALVSYYTLNSTPLHKVHFCFLTYKVIHLP